jgi:hypothetical protein
LKPSLNSLGWETADRKSEAEKKMNDKCNVFYSWESDLPDRTNRAFVQSALESAAESIRGDDSISVEPVIDRDTIGVPGAPDIAGTIFAKIEQSQVFVVDVSIINSTYKFRQMPNPNVLIELGYALKALGADRVIMVMNRAFGNPELLPFDLRMKRVVAYEMPSDATDESSVRNKLASSLEQGIREIIGDIENTAVEAEKSAANEAVEVVNKMQPNQIYLVREYMKDSINSFLEFTPNFPDTKDQGEADDVFIHSVEKTLDKVVEFSKVAEAIAVLNARESALSLIKVFYEILERYNPPQGFSGTYNSANLDYFKFIGHELFVTFISFLIRDNRWEIITEILDDSILVKNTPYSRPRSFSFEYISEYIESFQARKMRLKSKRMSLHADLLNERHSNQILGGICPMDQFVSADYFLFLKAEFRWRPWSTLYINRHFPNFIIEATRLKYANQLLGPLGVGNIDMLRELLRSRATKLKALYRTGFWDSGLENFDYSSIGSK